MFQITEAQKEEIRRLAGPQTHFTVDSDGLCVAYQYNGHNGRPERIAEEWYWDEVISVLRKRYEP